MEDRLIMSFGSVLRDLRLDKNMTQEEMGFAAEIQRKHVSSLELGLKQPSLSTIFKLARALQMRPSQLIAQVEQVQGDPNIRT